MPRPTPVYQRYCHFSLRLVDVCSCVFHHGNSCQRMVSGTFLVVAAEASSFPFTYTALRCLSDGIFGMPGLCCHIGPVQMVHSTAPLISCVLNVSCRQLSCFPDFLLVILLTPLFRTQSRRVTERLQKPLPGTMWLVPQAAVALALVSLCVRCQ